jgi:type VI secretion system secreted protein VgrG
MRSKTSASSAIAADLLAYNRYIAVTSAAFETEEITLLSMNGVERLGEPFRYEIRIISRRRIRNFTGVVGQPLTVGLKLADNGTRHFNGIVRNFSYMGLDDTRRPIYVAEIVPWLSLLEFRRNSRIFQNMTSLEIVRLIFDDYKGVAVFQIKTDTTPPKRVFCVQYDETDFNFVSRLLEQDGIYYFFVHEENQHELILADSVAAHQPCQPQVIKTNPSLEHNRFHNDLFWEWNENASLQSGKIVMNDYDHEKPAANLEAQEPMPAVQTGGVPTLNEERAVDGLGGGPSGESQAMMAPGPDADRRELFFFPGRYNEKADGDFYAKVRAEELGCNAYRAMITGNPRQLCAGNTFKAANPFEIIDTELAPEPTQSWLAISALITITGEELTEDRKSEEGYLYRCTIEAQPATNQYRSPLRTPRPVIPGPQTAVTVGRPGEVITTDQYGRIKVQFFWDRLGQKNENSSCWIRAVQNWAGKNFGGLVTPRVGQEVVVAFVGGNPDWPLVTGAVYNAVNMPPEDLPTQSARSTFKTRSVDGSANEFNELRFEDKLGEEEIYLKAQKDHTTEVAQNETKTVGQTYSLRATRAICLSVGGNAIVINELGIQITSKVDVTVSAGGDVNLSGAAAAAIEAAGVMNIAGAQVNIAAVDGAILCAPMPVPVPV